jgi:hypothetical protein
VDRFIISLITLEGSTPIERAVISMGWRDYRKEMTDILNMGCITTTPAGAITMGNVFVSIYAILQV